MSIEKTATVTIRAEGEDDVARAAQKVSSAWQSAGSAISGGFKGAASAVTDSVRGIVSDIGHVITAVGAINFAQSVEEVRRFEDSVSKLSVASGVQFDSLKKNINELSADIGELPEDTEKWISAVSQLTYSYKAAAEGAKGMAQYAALTGQGLPQVQSLAVALEQVGGVTGDATKEMGIFASQAEIFKRNPKEIGDAYAHLATQISYLANAGDARKVGALLAGFGGQELSPLQRERSLAHTFDKLEGNTVGLSSLLGHKVTDRHGHMTDFTGNLAEIQQKAKSSRTWRGRFIASFGEETLSAIEDTNIGQIRAAENVDPSKAPAEALAKSKALQDLKQNEIKKRIEREGMFGKDGFFGKMISGVSSFSADHQLLSQAGMMMAAPMLGKAGGAIMGALGGLSVGASAALLGTAAGAYGFGTAIDRGLGVSDLITGTGSHSRIKSAEDASDVEDNKVLAARVRDIRVSNARKHMLQGQPQTAIGAAAGDARTGQMIDQLAQAGASLKLAQDAAQKLLASGSKGITIEVVNYTGGNVDAVLRGQQ